MLTVQFANTDLIVSPLALGSVGYGTSTDEKTAFRQMDAYREVGNFIDTAHVYGRWGASGESESELLIGRWLKSRGMRGKIAISTKGGHPFLTGAFIPRLHRAEIEKDLNESLSHLGLDAIDLYFLHRDDETLPVIEILETMESLRREGKIRHYGVSNWKLPRIREAEVCAREHGFEGFTVNQLKWSLAHVNADKVEDRTLVNMDAETYRYHASSGLGAMAYTSIAKGYFAHRAAGTPVREKARAVYDSPENEKILSALIALSRESGLSVAELSMCYFLYSPFPSVAIASFSNDRQTEEGLSVLRHEPDKEIVRRVQALRDDLR